jgi:hypothetical protein
MKSMTTRLVAARDAVRRRACGVVRGAGAGSHSSEGSGLAAARRASAAVAIALP